MRGGRLRFRITFQEKVVTRNSRNEEVIAWTNLTTNPEVWADIENLRGREFYDAQRAGAELDTRFTIRYRSDLTEDMRIQYDSKTYDIQAIIHVGERQREMHLMCRRISGEEEGQ